MLFKRGRVFFLVFAAFLIASVAQAATSTNYSIIWDSINSGGDDISSSTNYQLKDTIGEQGTGISSSTNYEVRAGYRQGASETAFLSFDFGTQENSTQTAYTAYSEGSKTVIVASTSSYSVGDFIGVIENLGLSQVSAIGKIVSISGDLITVDKWDGTPSSLSGLPAGGDDFVYRLEGVEPEFGTLSATTGNTSETFTSILTNAENGYTTYVNTDGDFKTSGTAVIGAVSDGAVTVGSEEYGARVFGATATSTGSDFGLSTSFRAIQVSTKVADDDRIVLIYKISISPSVAAGIYSQKVFYTVTPNF